MFVIVKHASDSYWPTYWKEDPKLGVFASHSVHDTNTGIKQNIRPQYILEEEAAYDCMRINKVNPSGGYAVYKVITA